MPQCLIPNCINDANNNLGIRCRRPDTTAIWAPNCDAFLCDDHADQGYTISITLTPVATSTITTSSKSEGTSKNFSIQERERIKPQDILQFDVGHFCGILVEGSNKEFNTRFKNISCEPVSMPERNFFFDVESNFRTIHAQIKELVQ